MSLPISSLMSMNALLRYFSQGLYRSSQILTGRTLPHSRYGIIVFIMFHSIFVYSNPSLHTRGVNNLSLTHLWHLKTSVRTAFSPFLFWRGVEWNLKKQCVCARASSWWLVCWRGGEPGTYFIRLIVFFSSGV